MKMTGMDVRLIVTPPPHAGGKLWYTVRIHTDEGIDGLGESMPHFAFAGMEKSYRTLALCAYERWFSNRDPFDRDALMQAAYNEFCAGHPDMLGMSVLSAIEMAMWDICGKALRRPVCDLLGGAHRKRLRAYSYISYDDMRANGKNYADLVGDPALVRERALEMAEMGFTALKIDPLEYRIPLGSQPQKPYPLEREDFRRTHAVLDALKDAVGESCDILIGTHGQMTTAGAIRYAKHLECYDPLFYEEPVPPGNMEEMARVQRATSIPIAAGERIMTVYEASCAVECGALAVLQPDLGTCGGITQAYRMAAVAQSHFATLSPHLWGGPILTSAAIQLSLSIPNFLIQECILTADGFYRTIAPHMPRWEKGYLYPSGGAGLGVELDEKTLEQYLLH